MKNENNEILTGLKPTRLVVPELGETPISMTLFPRFVMDDAKIPEPQIFYDVEVTE